MFLERVNHNFKNKTGRRLESTSCLVIFAVCSYYFIILLLKKRDKKAVIKGNKLFLTPAS